MPNEFTIASMTTTLPHMSCYLVEWYRPELADDTPVYTPASFDECAASITAADPSVRLLMTLAVPTDEVVFAVFAANSAELVAQACDRAGIPAERLSSADAQIMSATA